MSLPRHSSHPADTLVIIPPATATDYAEPTGNKYKSQLSLLLLLIAFILFSLSGCAVLPRTDPYKPVTSLSSYGPFGAYEIPSRPTESQISQVQESLTLEQCVQIALEKNPELAATGWEVSAAGSRREQAKAAHWPVLSAEGVYNRFLDPQRLIQARFNGEPGFFDRDIFRSDLIVKMPLFTGGRIVNEIAAADLLRKAEENRLSRTREELVFNVSSIFYASLGQRSVIDSLDFSIKAMEEQHKRVNDLLAAQKAAKVDLLRTEVRLADLKQNMVKEENVLAVQKRVLANLMGLDYDTERLSFEGTLTYEEPVFTADNLISEALGNRPDYRAAREKLEAQAKRVDIARAGHWPVVSVQGSYGLRADALGDKEDVGTIGVGMTVPLFEGGRVVAKVNEERATLAAARERLRKLELQIRQDVETAVLDIRSSSARARALDKAIEQARESLRIERQKYDLGVGSMTDVLDAQSALLQSETSYYRALADLKTAISRLEFATGGNRS